MTPGNGFRALALAAVMAAGAGSALATTAGAAPKGKKPKVHKATVGHGYYGPSSLSIKVGDKVRWTWQSSLFDLHDITVEKGPERFEAPAQSRGTYTRTFKKAGTFLLVCTQHPSMTQTLKVKKR